MICGPFLSLLNEFTTLPRSDIFTYTGNFLQLLLKTLRPTTNTWSREHMCDVIYEQLAKHYLSSGVNHKNPEETANLFGATIFNKLPLVKASRSEL